MGKVSDFLYKHEKVIGIIVMVAFAILTTMGIFTHEPWRDEAQAWLISQDLNIFNLLKHMRYEGHLFLWYLAMMPFSKLHIPYPMPMLIINLLFMWGAVFIFWKKAPFNPLLKILITFSAPIFYQYAILARPYAIGILLLFALTALYKEKLNRPYLYATLIFLCANTSSLALLGAVAFGLLFLIDYLKNKKSFWKTKEFYIVLSIAIFCALIVLFQIFGAKDTTTYQVVREYYFVSLFDGLARYSGNPYLCLLGFLIFVAVCMKAFLRNFKVFTFFAITFAGLTTIFAKFYSGLYWHHYFYFIYLVITFWLFDLEAKPSDKKFSYKLLMTWFVIMTLSLVNWGITEMLYDYNNRYASNEILAMKIQNDENLKNANLVICDGVTHGVIPYLRQRKIPVNSCYNGKSASFFDQSHGDNYYLRRNNLEPSKFEKFEDKSMYLLYTYKDEITQLESKYYNVEEYFCLTPGLYDSDKLCVASMKRKKKVGFDEH